MSRRTITATAHDGYYDAPMVVTFCADDVRIVAKEPDNDRRCLVWFADMRHPWPFWCLPDTMTAAVYRNDVATLRLSSTHTDSPE